MILNEPYFLQTDKLFTKVLSAVPTIFCNSELLRKIPMLVDDCIKTGRHTLQINLTVHPSLFIAFTLIQMQIHSQEINTRSVAEKGRILNIKIFIKGHQSLGSGLCFSSAKIKWLTDFVINSLHADV